MHGQDEPTIGEVFRLCERIDDNVKAVRSTLQDHGERIAVLEATTSSGGRGRGRAALAGTAAGGFLVAAIEAAKAWFSKP